MAGSGGHRRAGRGGQAGAVALGGSGPAPAGAAAGRGGLADRRPAAVAAQPVALGISEPPAGLSAERGALRDPRCTGLPRPGRGREPVQHQGGIAAARGLQRGGDACAARPAHRGDRAALRRRGAGTGVGPDVAGERAGPRCLLPAQAGAGPLAADHGARHPRRPRAAHPPAGDAPGAVGGEAPRGPGAPGDRADPERGGGPRGVAPGHRVCAGPGADRAAPAAACRQPDLRGGDSARVDERVGRGADGTDGVVRGRGRRVAGGEADGVVPAFLPGDRRALGGAFRLRGGGSAAHPAGVPAPDRERGRAPGAGVRDRSGADGPADLLAAGRRGGPLRGGVQGCAQGSGSGGPGGAAADGGLPGPAGLGERPLVVFDRNPAKSGEEKIYRRAEEYEGKAITVWGM